MVKAKTYKTLAKICLLAAVLSVVCFAARADKLLDDNIHFTAVESEWEPTVITLLKSKPTFLPATLDLGIPPAPLNSSRTTADDLKALLLMQKEERTPDQIEKIKYEAENWPVQAVIEAVNPKVMDYPQTLTMLMQADHDALFFTVQQKWKFKRARPTQLSPELTTVVPIPKHAAYPSGHATQSYAGALLLGMLDPANKDAYEKAAIAVAHRREIAGLHYPSDGVAGRHIATVAVNALMQNKQFVSLFDEAKQEFQTGASGIPMAQSSNEHKS